MVWLNAGSTLSYDRQLGVENRDVRLVGEAFFVVKENTQHPFTVEAKGTLIHVVGTSFNVKAYLEEDYVETTVVEGIVKVLSAQNSDGESSAIILKPKQRLIISSYSRSESATINAEKLNDASESKQSAGKIRVSSNVNTELYTSWKEEKWMINSEKLGDLAIQIERRYDVVIYFRDPEIKQFVYSGILKDENLEEVLQIIASTSPIKFEIDNKSVYLSKGSIIRKEE
jgi:ferric-dicitrate binding protein FerR (iron transport regulator)